MTHCIISSGFLPSTMYRPLLTLSTILQGRDKFENEDLIKYSLPHDIWFHVDNLSSAHVYLRLPAGQTLDTIPPEPLEDCCQLVKANSIQGNKINNVDIVYTPASNLKKTGGMVIGQVGFHNEKLVKKAKVDTRKNDIINRLNKTRQEVAEPDLEGEYEAYQTEVRAQKKVEIQAQEKAEKAAKKEQQRQKELMSYDRVFVEDAMTTAKDMREKYSTPEEYEDDFM